uniref:Uncharacterized protein n=1 Tax=Tetranychus urticae TaxID=32264 RepID=T1JR96_TETUR
MQYSSLDEKRLNLVNSGSGLHEKLVKGKRLGLP